MTRKLSEADKIEILALYYGDEHRLTQRQIAYIYSVDASTISRALSDDNWAHAGGQQ